MPTYLVTDPATGRKLKLTGDSPPTDQELEEIFAQQSAPQSIEQQIKPESSPVQPAAPAQPDSYLSAAASRTGAPAQMAATATDTAVQQANANAEARMAELEKTNPYLAAQIKAMTPTERTLAGIGMGFNDIARATGASESQTLQKVGDVYRSAVGAIPGVGDYLSRASLTPGSTQATDRPLTDVSNAASAGQIVGQAAPFIAPGAGIANFASIPARVAASGALGATEGALIARGTEQAGPEQVKSGLIGGGIGIAAEAIPIVGPALVGFVRRRLGKTVTPEQLVQPNGQLTPEFSQYLDSQGITPEQAIREAQTESGTASVFAENAPRTAAAAESGANIDIPAALAAVDPRLVKIWTDRGVAIEDVPLAAVSRNNQVAEMSAQLAAVPGSGARDIAIKAAEVARNAARDTIEEAGGSMAAGEFSERTLNSMRATRETLYQAENTAYTQLGNQIEARLAGLPPVSVRAHELKSELIRKASRLRETGLSTVEAKALKILSGKPSYYDIDNFRKEIGDSIGDIPKGVYADQAQGTLKHIYGQLQEAQNKFARGLLGSDALRSAQSISRDRNSIQDQIEFFGGKDGFGSMVANLKQVAGGLSRDDFAQFDRVMDNVPEQYRKGALATIMNQSLRISPDATMEGAKNAGFANMWSNIRGDAALNSRVKNILGEDSYNAFDKIADMSKGVSRALGGKQTGIALVALKEFDKPNGILAKLAKTMRLGSAASGIPGGGQAAAMVDGISAIAQAGDTSTIGNVTRMISSPTFMKAAIEAARDPASAEAKALSATLMKTKAANDFMSAATADARKQIIAAGGIPLWLMTSQNEEEKQ